MNVKESNEIVLKYHGNGNNLDVFVINRVHLLEEVFFSIVIYHHHLSVNLITNDMCT